MNEALTAAVRGILQNPRCQEWTVQGFGFIRCYLDPLKRWRLNIWDNDLATPNVSLIHDHPWRFDSYVIAGLLTNIRYTEDAEHGDWYHWQVLVPGIDGGARYPGGIVGLIRPRPDEVYGPGCKYAQGHREIHHTEFRDGTVTLNDRCRMGADLARIFWPIGTEWVDAKPRPAKPVEIDKAVGKALAQMETRL